MQNRLRHQLDDSSDCCLLKQMAALPVFLATPLIYNQIHLCTYCRHQFSWVEIFVTAESTTKIIKNSTQEYDQPYGKCIIILCDRIWENLAYSEFYKILVSYIFDNLYHTANLPPSFRLITHVLPVGDTCALFTITLHP